MKRLQILVPDALYLRVQREAQRQEWTVSEVVRRGIEKQLESAVDQEPQIPSLKPLDLGGAKLPEDRWRDAIYEDLTG
jgi:hypothetical protein